MSSEIEQDRDVTIKEFAAHPAVNVHRDTIRKWIDRGLIPAKRVGPKRIKIPLRTALAAMQRPIEPAAA